MSDSSCNDIVYDTWKNCSKPIDVIPQAKYLREMGLSRTLTTISINRKVQRQSSFDTQYKKGIIKPEILKSALVAVPNHVEFRDLYPNRLYKKTVTLINVGTVPVKFHIQARPPKSKFIVMFKNKEENTLLPGMCVRLIVLFRSEIYEEPSEYLTINVQNRRPLIIQLTAYRSPPILRATSRAHCESPESLSNIDFSTIANDDWDVIINSAISESSEQLFSIGSTSESEDSETSSSYKSITGNIFDCGKCFVGEQITLPIVYTNVGGRGRFFILGEIDWSSMDVQDVTPLNIIILPTFAVWPAYFILEPEEKMTLNIYFFPDSYGMHVDKLHIICDNCSMKTAEIIGDGIMFETSFLKFGKHLKKRWPSDINFDGPADYYIHLGRSPPNSLLQSVVSVTNTSGLILHYRWAKRHSEDEEDLINVDIHPDRGYFPPSNVLHFNIIASIPDLPPDNYFITYQLYVEDIPLAAIPKEYQFVVEDSVTKRRSCSISVDIWIASVEVWLECTPKEEVAQPISIFLSESPEQSIDLTSQESLSTIHDTTDEEDNEIDAESYKYSRSLTTVELFSSLDVVNVRTRKLLFHDATNVTGVLRLTRPLFVGIEEKYPLSLRNISNRSQTYDWGPAEGSDLSKLRVLLRPASGTVPAHSYQEIQIILVPLDTGVIQALHVPCYVGDSHLIILGIEGEVKSFYVTFHLPATDDKGAGFHVGFTRFEWHPDSLLSLLKDFSEHQMELETILEERELMTIDLDESKTLKESSAAISQHTIESEQMQEEVEDESISERLSSHVVLFEKSKTSQLVRKAILEFPDLPLMTARKKTFVITNETPVSSHVRVAIKNFFPRHVHGKESKKNRINEIYRCTLNVESDIWSEMKQVTSGLLVYIEPQDADLDPYGTVSFDVYAYADTWGTYTDELEINIVGLPEYILPLQARIAGSPISFPVCEKTDIKRQILRFGTNVAGLASRKVVIRNTSVLPLIINWHKFLLISPSENDKAPFNVILDICTPFTNKLATSFTEMSAETERKRILENRLDRYESRNFIKEINQFGTVSLTDSVTSTTENSIDEEVGALWSTDTEGHTASSFFKEYNLQSVGRSTVDQNRLYIIKDTEVKIGIIPNHGKTSTRFCTIYPEEIFIPPKRKTSISITMDTRNYSISENSNQIIYKVLGFIRIAPMHKYKDNYYLRVDGYSLPPVEFRVEAKIIKPQLFHNICKADRTFTFNAESILKTAKKKTKLKKSYVFYNKEEAEITVNFVVNEPFSIERIKSCDERSKEHSEVIYMKGRDNVEVVVSCTINSNFIEEVLENNLSCKDSKITTEGFLYIKHSDSSVQVVELILNIQCNNISLLTKGKL